MVPEKCRVRVGSDFTVSMRKRKKGGHLKDKTKEYLAGEWLKGVFVEVNGFCMFRSGKFLLSPMHFDRIKLPEMVSIKLVRTLSCSPGEIQQDYHDRHELFV